MILGTKARYAVMAMVELAGRKEDKPVSLAELAGSQEMTVPYLEQIFARLRQCKLVSSVRGPGGGYVLTRKPADIHIADIIFAVDEAMKITRCANHNESGCMSGKSRCLTHDLWEGLERHIHDYLQSITLEDVLNRKALPHMVLAARGQGVA